MEETEQNRMEYIRQATAADASRLAEILVFTKRMNYRRIFNNDAVSFNEIQVYPLAREFIEDPNLTAQYYVYDDGIVKGLVHVDGEQICELYVDHFFQDEGIGGKLIEAAYEMGCRQLWVLEKNDRAIRFYEKHGFLPTGERRLQEPTPEYVILMRRSGSNGR